MNACVHLQGDINVSANTIQQSSVLNGRQMLLVVVVGLHAVVISALMAMRITGDILPPPPVFKPVTDITPVQPLPPEQRPRVPFDDSEFVVDLPRLPQPQFQKSEPIWNPPDPGPATVPEAGGAEDGFVAIPEISPTELLSRATRSPNEFYPPVSVQRGEEGAAEVRVCVGPSGRLEGQPTMLRSSGSRHLDAAALAWAREAMEFTPATRNGSPVSACKGFRVNFSLR